MQCCLSSALLGFEQFRRLDAAQNMRLTSLRICFSCTSVGVLLPCVPVNLQQGLGHLQMSLIGRPVEHGPPVSISRAWFSTGFEKPFYHGVMPVLGRVVECGLSCTIRGIYICRLIFPVA